MFQWLRKQVRPYTVNDLIEELVPGHRASMAREDQRRHEMDKQWHEQEVQMLKRARLEQDLEDAEWILAYERRLTKLQTKTKAQRSRAEQVGANSERLRRLEHHLAGLLRNLSLD